MKIIYFCLLLFGSLQQVFSQTILYSTNFGTIQNVNPAGWTFTGIDMNISNNNASSSYSNASGGCYVGEGNSVAFVNTFSVSQPSSQIGTSSAEFTVSTSGFSVIVLSFGMRKSSSGYNTNATYSLDWSSNGTNYTAINYTEAIAGSWGLASGAGLTLPPGAGNQPSLYIRWTFVRTGTASNFKIDDVSVVGNPPGNNSPSIAVDVASTSNFLDGGVNVSPNSPFDLSGVIADPTDPARNLGINFIISDPQVPPGSLTVTAVSSDLNVVPTSDLILTGSGASRNLKIDAVYMGFSNITLSVNNGTYTTPYVIHFGASAPVVNGPGSSTAWHTGMSDASDAIALDDNYYITADDEMDVISVYSRSLSGLPLVSFNYSTSLTLPDPSKPETDIEAAVTSPTMSGKKYILGSMSTGGNSFNVRPTRDCLLSTLISGTGSLTTFSVQGYYTNLRTHLLNWGDANGYNFTASAASGVNSKLLNGYAAEGMAFGPDNTTLFIAFRAPLVPIASRTNAVIAPISNFETWYNNGTPVGTPVIGAPIELNLGGRGIRDIVRLSGGTYIIIAGNPCEFPNITTLYKWSGNPVDAPIFINAPVNGALNLEGLMEVKVGGIPSSTKLQVITDMGTEDFYLEGISAKDQSSLSLRKFRSDYLDGINLCLDVLTPTISINGNILSSSAGPAYQWYYNNAAIPGATLQTYSITANGNYYVVVSNSVSCTAISSITSIINVGLANSSENKSSFTIYPNPFNDNTGIHFNLVKDSKVSVEVYSLIGQKIITVTNSTLNTGDHLFTINMQEYAAGVYFVKTTIDSRENVTRIINYK